MALVPNMAYASARGSGGSYYQDDKQGWKYKPFRSAPKPLPFLTYYRQRIWRGSARDFTKTPNSPPWYNPSDTYEWIKNSQAVRFVLDNRMLSDGTVTGLYSKTAQNKALAKLQEQVFSDTASLGVSVAEGREAIASIVDRASRLGKAYKELRRGRFKSFLRQIGGRPKEKHKHTHWTRPKDASSLWLEYWLGWAPLCGDILASAQTLANPGLFTEVNLRSKGVVQGPRWAEGTVGGIKTNESYERCYAKCTLGCHVKVTNPNDYLAARLGLLDWPVNGWAVVPFSFVIDWFVNIGQVLSNMAFDRCGVKYSGWWITHSSVCYGSIKASNTWGSESCSFSMARSGASVIRRRLSSGPGYYLVPNINLSKGLSPTRGATAISLLLSIFTKG